MTAFEDRIQDFRAALRELDEAVVIDRYFLTLPAAMLSTASEASLRRKVAERFGVEMRDVLVTGSAKLGFTLVSKPERPALSPFGDTSDIDVAIISTPLFVGFWRRAFLYHTDHGEWDRADAYRKYLARGWLRPDYLPRSPEFPERREWFEFFANLQGSQQHGPYKISAGIYYDESFWSAYARTSLAKCRQFVEEGI